MELLPRLDPVFLAPLHRAATGRILRAGWIALLLLCAGGCSQQRGRHRARAPSAVFAQVEYDFGTVEQGTAVTHAFPFRNDGDIELHIDELRSGCGCLAALADPRPVKPHAAGEVQVTLDTTALSGDQRRTVTVYSNDPKRRTVLLVLRGTVAADVAISPQPLFVGRVARGHRIEDAALALLLRDTAEIDSIGTTGNVAAADSQPLTDGRRGRSINLTISPDAPLGPFEQILDVRTGGPEGSVQHLTVAGVVIADLVAAPKRLDFSDAAAGEMRQVLIDNHSDTAHHVTGAEWDQRLGKVEVETVEEGARYRLRATLAPDLAPGTVIDRAVRVHTDDPQEEVLEVPTTGRLTVPAPPTATDG
jgi:Protein of unknown function (DUF1573)